MAKTNLGLGQTYGLIVVNAAEHLTEPIDRDDLRDHVPAALTAVLLCLGNGLRGTRA